MTFLQFIEPELLAIWTGLVFWAGYEMGKRGLKSIVTTIEKDISGGAKTTTTTSTLPATS